MTNLPMDAYLPKTNGVQETHKKINLLHENKILNGVKYYMGSGLVSCMKLGATTGHLLQLLGVSSPFLDLGTTATL